MMMMMVVMVVAWHGRVSEAGSWIVGGRARDV